MITNVQTGSPWLNVGGQGLSLPYISESQHPMQGVVRLINGRYEAWNVSGWMTVSSIASINVSPMTDAALDWVHKKMHQEATLSQLAKQYPAVADAVSAVKQAEEKLNVVIALTQENT